MIGDSWTSTLDEIRKLAEARWKLDAVIGTLASIEGRNPARVTDDPASYVQELMADVAPLGFLGRQEHRWMKRCRAFTDARPV